MTEPTPRKASPAFVVFSAAVTVYFLWVLFFAREGQPLILVVFYVLAVVANLAFLFTVVRRWLG